MRWTLHIALVAIALSLFGLRAEGQGIQFIDRNSATDAYQRGMQEQQELELRELQIERARGDLERQRALAAERQRLEADMAAPAAKAAPARKKAKAVERSPGSPAR